MSGPGDVTPIPVAEPGVTTSEFQGLVAASGVLIAGGIAVINDFGVRITETQKFDLISLDGALLMFAWIAYGVYRSWRKRGTTA